MASKTRFVVNELFKEFEDRHFFTIDDLYIFGLFGTKYAVRQALKSGVLPFVQISKRRRIVPKIALLEYLQINLKNNWEARTANPQSTEASAVRADFLPLHQGKGENKVSEIRCHRLDRVSLLYGCRAGSSHG